MFSTVQNIFWPLITMCDRLVCISHEDGMRESRIVNQDIAIVALNFQQNFPCCNKNHFDQNFCNENNYFSLQ